MKPAVKARRLSDQAKRYVMARKELDDSIRKLVKASNAVTTAQAIFDTLEMALSTGQNDLFDDLDLK